MDAEKPDWEKHAAAYEGEIINANRSDYDEYFSETNLWYADVRSTRPKLYSQNPYLYVDPETPEADLHAEIMERVVNVQKDKAWKLKDRMLDAITGTKIQGRTYLKVSYKFSKDKIGREWAGEEPNDEIVIAYVPRDRLLIDPFAPSFKARRWAAHKIYGPIGEIREKFKIAKDVKISVVEEKNLPSDVTEEEKQDFQYGCYHEIENVYDHTLAILVDGMDKFAVKPYQAPHPFWSMYEELEWNNIPGKINTRGDLHFWWKLLVEDADSETQECNHARKLNSKYIVRGATPLDDKQKKDLKSYKDGQIVELPLGTQVETFQHASLGQEHYLRKQSRRQDIGIISVMNEMKQGLPQAEKTARESMLIASENQSVIQFMAGKVEDMVGAVISKCILLIQNNYDASRVMALTGMEDVEYIGLRDKVKGQKFEMLGDAKRPFIRFVGTELTGKFNVRVKAGSAMPVNEAQRRQDVELIIGLMGKDQEFSAGIDKRELGKEVAKVTHIENKNIIIDPKTPEQENALLKRDVPVMANWNEPHADHIKRHQLENNNTKAFLNHILSHKLMDSYISKSQMTGAPMPGMPPNLLNQTISGLPQGTAAPAASMPQPAPSQPPIGSGGLVQ